MVVDFCFFSKDNSKSSSHQISPTQIIIFKNLARVIFNRKTAPAMFQYFCDFYSSKDPHFTIGYTILFHEVQSKPRPSKIYLKKSHSNRYTAADLQS